MTDTALDDLKSDLENSGLSPSFRGEGRAAFLFVEHAGKAIEISDHEGRWWVEFWDVSEEDDDAPVKEEFFTTSIQVTDAATGWLLHRAKAGAI
jgi:hypothetical protein